MLEKVGAAILFVAVLAGSAEGQAPDAPEVPEASAAPDTVILQGRIVDGPTRRPLPYTWVGLAGARSTTVSGEGGRFRLTVPRDSVYVLQVGHIGYLDMDYRITPDLAEKALVLPLEPAPIEVRGLEVTVDGIEKVERDLTRRARASTMASRTLSVDDIAQSSAVNALEIIMDRTNGALFPCLENQEELCSRARPLASTSQSGAGFRTQTVLVCIDEERAMGSIGYLRSIPAHEIHRLDLFGFNGRDQVRVYTRWFMVRQAADPRALPTLETGC